MSEVFPARPVSNEGMSPVAGEKQASRKAKHNSPIGMFDSGVGGLTVLSRVMQLMPSEDVVYFGDTARVPYGGRTPNEILRFNQEIMDLLIGKGCKAVIMACGTSSAIAYPILKDKYQVPIIQLIEPGSRAALRATENRKIGVIATQATVDSGAYERTIKRISKDVQVFQNACPMFVPLIEGGFIEAEETKKVAAQYIKPLKKAGIDTLILGCTHYPHLAKVLHEVSGIKVKFVDPAEETAIETRNLLSSKGLLSKKLQDNKGKYSYYVSGSPMQFEDIGSRLLGSPIRGVVQVSFSGRKQNI